MEFQKTFFAIIIFSMIIVAVSSIINLQGEKYASNVTSDLEGGYNKLNDMDDMAGVQQGRISPQSGEASSDYEAEIFRSGYGVISDSHSSLRSVYGADGMLDNAVNKFGLPSYIYQGIVTMIVIAITLGIIAIIFRLSRGEP